MSQQLIAVRTSGETLTVSSLDFASGLGIQHKNLLETIRTHKQAIEESFGQIAFETLRDSTFETPNLVEGKKSTKPYTVAYLTEDQALFIGTLSRNSKQVVEFKSVLVKSFAQARQQLQPQQQPSALSTEQLLVKLISQQTELLTKLRSDVDSLMAGQRLIKPATPPHLKRTPALSSPRKRPASDLRQAVNHHVNEYCGYFGAEQGETYNYLYKRMYDVYGVSVYRLIRQQGESLLDAIERYGYLDKVYALLMAELKYADE